MTSLKLDGKLSIQFRQDAPPPAPGAPAPPPGGPPPPGQADNPPAGNLYHQLCVMNAVMDQVDRHQEEQRLHRENTLCLFTRQIGCDLRHLQDRLDQSEHTAKRERSIH